VVRLRPDTTSVDVLYHIVSNDEFAAAPGGAYAPAAFVREGFVHCSYLRQLVAVGNRIFPGRQDLVVLEIDPSRLTCRIVDENLEGGTELYPHVYGTITPEAVVRVLDFRCGPAGFELPDALQSVGPSN
jgi:uncharacterized protein (DUF952 family)